MKPTTYTKEFGFKLGFWQIEQIKVTYLDG